MKQGHLGPGHPVAEVAGRLCRAHLGSLRLGLIGRVACGACWERAIRDDERAVVLFGLPREVERDPDLVDEIAVELACEGESVRLTRREREEAVRRMASKRVPATVIAKRLRHSRSTANQVQASARVGGSAA